MTKRRFGNAVTGAPDVMAKTSNGTPMTRDAAARVQSAGDRHPTSDTARTRFAPRAQSAAAHNEPHDSRDGDRSGRS
ncbi:hypothetical protein [Frankia sp. Cas3]|uniref:hypothetical protein n=1 Tax=Frankia sp. Cas3 TaxID=3073926 RepID=UPI002AD27097|nr:hypothetical protein [Frankia sp. Cas3]